MQKPGKFGNFCFTMRYYLFPLYNQKKKKNNRWCLKIVIIQRFLRNRSKGGSKTINSVKGYFENTVVLLVYRM